MGYEILEERKEVKESYILGIDFETFERALERYSSLMRINFEKPKSLFTHIKTNEEIMIMVVKQLGFIGWNIEYYAYNEYQEKIILRISNVRII